MPLPWQRTFHQVKKYVLHIYTSRPTSVLTYISNALFSSIFGIMCRYHGNTLSATVENVSCTFTPKGRHLFRIPWESVKNWGSSSRRKISPYSLPIIYGTMATHFLPLLKLSCTSTPQGKHLCRIPWESVKNWGSSSRRKIFPHFLPIIYGYHGNTLSATVKNCVLHIYNPRQTSVPNSMRIGQKLK